MTSATSEFIPILISACRWVFMLGGTIVLLWGMFGISKSLFGSGVASWGSAIVKVVVGGAMSAGSFMLPLQMGDKNKATPKQTTPGDTSSQSPPLHSPVPSTAEQTPQPAPGPIRLPRLENPETLWLVPIGLLVLLLGYVLAKRLVLDARKMKKEKAALLARQARLDAKWKTITDRHHELKLRYLEAETDWDMLFNYPALTDVTVPETAAMLRAMQAAADADDHRPDNLEEDADLSTMAYPKAVATFGVAWDAALRHARKMGQTSIPSEERKQIRQIRDLLAIAENTGATENERQLAYSQAHSLMKKLRSVVVPAKAMAQIEDHKRLMLTR